MYNEIVILHAVDESTEFLDVFTFLDSNYIIIEPNEKSIEESLSFISNLEKTSLIIFLGHGHSAGLYSSESKDFEKKTIINKEKANLIFDGHDVLLLSCRSEQFIKKLKNYNNIIGFGNIISSIEEISNEAEQTGEFRDLEKEDIDFFNDTYSIAIFEALQLLIDNKIFFRDLPKYIDFFINKEINSILMKKEKKNRIEVSRLLYEFRNDMIYKRNT